MHEIEIKLLDIDEKKLVQKLEELGAEKTQEVMLKVDWFSLPGIDKNNQPWFLRVRSYSTGKIEITWKGKHDNLGQARQVQEINLKVEDHDKTKMLFEAIGLEAYAHQEKKRISWKLDKAQFDLDTYPKMNPYLEIEAGSEEEINSLIQKLDLEGKETWNDGERTLIEGKYNLNWSDMRF